MVKERAGNGYKEFDRRVTTSDKMAFNRAKKTVNLLAGGVTDFAEIGRLASGSKRRPQKAARASGEVGARDNGRGHHDGGREG